MAPEGRLRLGSAEMLGRGMSIYPSVPPPSLYPAELWNARSHTHDGASDIPDTAAAAFRKEKEETEDTNWERSLSTHNISGLTFSSVVDGFTIINFCKFS